MNNTPNFGFKKPSTTEFYNVEDFNCNSDIVDEKLKDLYDNKADLVEGKVPSYQLPSYVDDVIEYSLKSQLPTTGEQGKIYVVYGDTTTNNGQYRWTGSTYTLISNPLDYATQIEAEAGTENTKVMTVLRVWQAIAKWFATNTIGTLGALTNVAISASDTIKSALEKLQGQIDMHKADYASDTGVANAYKITLNPVPTSYEIGKVYRVKIANTNTGASTFQINSLAVTPIKKGGSSALTGSELNAGHIVNLVYDGTNFQTMGITTTFDMLDRLKGVDGDGSGLDADTLDGLQGANVANTCRLTATQLNNTKLKSGFYTNTGDGLLNNDTSVFLGGWWHVQVSQHWDNNGYGMQIATPLDQDGFSRYYRISVGTTFQPWRKILDARDIGVNSSTTGVHRETLSASGPSGGVDGDIWHQYV